MQYFQPKRHIKFIIKGWSFSSSLQLVAKLTQNSSWSSCLSCLVAGYDEFSTTSFASSWVYESHVDVWTQSNLANCLYNFTGRNFLLANATKTQSKHHCSIKVRLLWNSQVNCSCVHPYVVYSHVNRTCWSSVKVITTVTVSSLILIGTGTLTLTGFL
jgi:hypothetical protein